MFSKLKKQAKEKYDKTFHKDAYNEMHDESQIGKEEQKEIKMEIPNSNDQKKCTQSETTTPKKKDTSTFSKMKHSMSEAQNYVSNKVEKAEQSVKKQLNKIDQKIKNVILEQKEHLNEWIAHKVDDKVISIMGSMEPKISSSIQKSVPYDWMQTFTNDAIIHVWKDFTELVRFELRVNIVEPKCEIRIKGQPKWYSRLRIWIVYSLYPADLTQRDHMRRFSFILLKSLQFIPYYGIQSFLFLLIFLCIDKKEEFQLVNLIVDFKQLQFITIGLFATIFGYTEYFLFDKGPGEHQHIYIILVGYLVQVLVIWVSFVLLQTSQSKATFLTDNMSVTLQGKGGRLKYFMVYEAIILLIVLGLSILIYFLKFPGTPLERLGDLVFFARTMYGMLSMPFILFTFSFFVRMLTTAVPTGYDKYGNVIPCVNTLHMKYKELPLERQKLIDIEEVMNQ